ncbi:hypothetical protein COW36_08930 [bacterium (Candidatus Blackallbacteria) CG17_big_fil_post_rev_8_21_14_2_50_48_46]|uniref:Phytanoyl-CoA dioxygenase n=1 Tax=bacterium (Candidatus Blackallbacteria) CG17_big_fil_post_rev_8_21_14_2_50_48_46 TaxID=2014261 RepID=A0A2M7G5V0_9BACT|nr:MAG: hypothetical protein COW64_24120 [bacterium (Candidatus Blackallbacteria) CG18_big_fil_WC_8_21_14_2_50_49_26]PIW17292.1 MAG: hypothetical protein COW36_08930 [bacterium (Candidatus Blackallbacteria) CG17_big_fil_post_rev_8_21_14_2_50_48_46]PIW47477.1 MAG: hypothetical protein COW20_12900 [bacterium (Candidatus Blackallbacteria) CG13_big_fil_rev_8_21_14_2_50_49_14]
MQIQAVNPALFPLILRFCHKHTRLQELLAELTPWLENDAPEAVRTRFESLRRAPLDWEALQNLSPEEETLLWDSLVLLTGLVHFPESLHEVLQTWAELLGYQGLEENFAKQREELERDLEEDRSMWLLRSCKALQEYWKTGLTPFYGFYSQRLLHLLSNQRSSSLWGYLAALFLPPRTAPLAEALIPESDFSVWMEGLKKEGYAVFPGQIPLEQVQNLVQFAENTPCTPSYHDREVFDRLSGKQLVEPILFDPQQPVARRYNFSPHQFVHLPEVQALMAHPDLWASARAYLQAEPQLVLASLWWSSDFQGPHSRYTGQVWHIDIDRFRFLNFFVYLTPVGLENGPHDYIRNTQGEKPLLLCVDKRMTPEEMEAHYAQDDFATICGPAGTIFAADTRAFHRGRPLEEGKRLILQLDFATDRFGENCPRVPVQATHSGFAEMRRTYPENFYNYPEV